MTQYLYMTRAEAGLTWLGTPPFETKPDGETFLHHVAGSAWMGGVVSTGLAASRAACIRVMQGLNTYAQRPKILGGKGYQFLDYDMLVWYDRYNDICWIVEGRGQYRSAATLDRNEQGEAICMCGHYGLRAPVPAELEGAARAIVIGVQQGWIAKDTWIGGHRDNPAHPGATACPGDLFYEKIPTIVARYNQLMLPAAPAPLPQPAPQPSPMEVETMVDFFDIDGLWSAPSLAAAKDPANGVWLNTCIAKVGSIADVQRRNGVKVTGLWSDETAAAYNKEFAAMKAAAGR